MARREIPAPDLEFIGSDDLHALFFAEGSLKQVEFGPMSAEADASIKPLFPDWRFLRMYPPKEHDLP